MSHVQVSEFQSCFEFVEDPRMTPKCAHPLNSILFLVVAAVIAGAEGPSDIQKFGEKKKDWLRKYIDLPNGIPSHDTIGRVLRLLKPKPLVEALTTWLTRLKNNQGGSGPVLIAIDGKTARGSYTDEDKSNPIHIISAWASESGLTLGQLAVESKSNEITAIPELLDSMELEGTIVTIDAMGCQKKIAKKIVDGGGDYTLAVKDNHPKLSQAIQDELEAAHEAGLVDVGFRSKSTFDKGHGREETRHYVVGPIPESIRELTNQWPQAKSIGSVTNVTVKNGQESIRTRYYINSRPPKVSEFAKSVRSHWGVESMHWILDVVFNEDASRIRKGHEAENMSMIRRFATSLFKRDTSKQSVKSSRKCAAWCSDFLEKVMGLS